MALAAGTKIGPYLIESLIGQGGMGEVYAAQDARLQRRVAIKIVPTHLSYNEDLRARFEQEAQARLLESFYEEAIALRAAKQEMSMQGARASAPRLAEQVP